MKQALFTISLIFVTSISLFGQKLSLEDLTSLCIKKNWEDVNLTLLSKGWTFYDSKKGSTYKYNTITWSFEKEYYNDKAHGWFYLYTYEGLPNKISYSVFNKESYSLVQNSISSFGFKLVKSEIEDNKVVSTYGNKSNTLIVSTEKQKDDDWSERSITDYNITIINKAGIYDPDNGKKTEYYYGDQIKSQYTLIEGKINGELKDYHYNGNLKKTGSFKNGLENGLFKEFGEYGNLESEYIMLNGEINGVYKTYNSSGKIKKYGNYLKGMEHGEFIEYDDSGMKEAEYVMVNGIQDGVVKLYKEGKIYVSSTLKGDIKNGPHINYFYNEETGKLELKQICEYTNDIKTGTWKLFFVNDENVERLLTFENYLNGKKNGPFQDINGDSLILGNYRNDLLHGDYYLYRDFLKVFLGGVINTDTSKIGLVNKGEYDNDLKSGFWKNYDFTNTLRNEGEYLNGEKNGEWKYYYTNYTNRETGSLSYSRELYLILNYKEGLLDGQSKRFSILNEEKYLCSEDDENETTTDSCIKYVYQKIFEIQNYKNDILNGPYELRDSLNNIFASGKYKNGIKDGEWIEAIIKQDFDGNAYYIYEKGYYINDKREGKWIQFMIENEIINSFNYKNGILNGEYITWNKFNKPKIRKQFYNGSMILLFTYDTTGVNLENMYEIYDETSISFKCRHTKYINNGSTSYEYFVKKALDIDHRYFEFIFQMALENNNTEGTHGYKNGAYILSDFNNQPIIKGDYLKEDSVGTWIYYYYDQNIKIESQYYNGIKVNEKYFSLAGDLFSGYFILSDIKNNLIQKRKIKDGLRNGKTLYSSAETNKILKKEIYKDGILK